MTSEEKNKKLTEQIEAQKKEIVETRKQLGSLQSDLMSANAQLSSLAEQGDGSLELERVSAERDQALQIISDLSQQVADQSSVKTEKEILVKVDGKKYLLEKRNLHTLNGEVIAVDAAKDMDFLRTLIQNGSGNIRLADK